MPLPQRGVSNKWVFNVVNLDCRSKPKSLRPFGDRFAVSHNTFYYGVSPPISRPKKRKNLRSRFLCPGSTLGRGEIGRRKPVSIRRVAGIALGRPAESQEDEHRPERLPMILAVSALSGQCLGRAGRLLMLTIMPSADFCIAVREPHGPLSQESRTPMQTSRVKFDRLPRTPAGFTPRPFDGYGLRCPLPARPARVASDPVSVRQVAVLLSTSFRPHLAYAAALRYPSPPSGWERTCTSKLSNMLGKQRVGGGVAAPVLPHHRTYGSVYGGSD